MKQQFLFIFIISFLYISFLFVPLDSRMVTSQNRVYFFLFRSKHFFCTDRDMYNRLIILATYIFVLEFIAYFIFHTFYINCYISFYT